MVLFTSLRSYERAENVRAVYDAYDGEKEFRQLRTPIDMSRYTLQVTDELPDETPGKCLFIGHGMGACKTYGLDMPRPYFRRPDLLTYAIASSKDMAPIVAKQCGISEDRVIPLGMPRTDAYFIPHETEQGMHLYAPTFRAGMWQPDFDKIWKRLPEGQKLVVKPHMVTGPMCPGHWQNIEMQSSQIPSTPFLMRCQTLVTDYSSIMFDAMVLRKPVVLFAKDRKDYLRQRGMYQPYPEDYSEYFCEREEDLVQLLQQAKWTDRAEWYRNFYTGACDGHSMERTLELIRSML